MLLKIIKSNHFKTINYTELKFILYLVYSYYLNICCSYTSRDEMTQACKEICNGVKDGLLDIKYVTFIIQ